jgi:hypothetical protein
MSGFTFIKKKCAGQVCRRRPEGLPYRCFFSDLAGFERLCRAGPTRTRHKDTASTPGCQQKQAFGSFFLRYTGIKNRGLSLVSS